MSAVAQSRHSSAAKRSLLSKSGHRADSSLRPQKGNLCSLQRITCKQRGTIRRLGNESSFTDSVFQHRRPCPHRKLVLANGQCNGCLDRKAGPIPACLRHCCDLGSYRPTISIQRHMAACHQSRHDGHYFSYGVSYTLALQVKLSELILALKDADNRIAAIEESSDEELQTAHEEIKERALHQN